ATDTSDQVEETVVRFQRPLRGVTVLVSGRRALLTDGRSRGCPVGPIRRKTALVRNGAIRGDEVRCLFRLHAGGERVKPPGLFCSAGRRTPFVLPCGMK